MTGTAQSQNGDYLGQPLNRVARLLAAGHGGQAMPIDEAIAEALAITADSTS
jgi:class 3 adenylate cyclase